MSPVAVWEENHLAKSFPATAVTSPALQNNQASDLFDVSDIKALMNL